MRIEKLKKYKKILLLGFGMESKSTLNFLHHFLPDIEIGVADEKLDIKYLEKQKDYDLVIRSPGLPKKLVTIPHTTATNIFFANALGTIVGITGSKGKSTTSSLLYAMLKEAGLRAKLVGNMGIPMLSTILHENDPETIYVCELSSYLLDDIEYSPHISIFLNFFPDHMDYHGGIEEYWKAKKRIIAKATLYDSYIYNPAELRLAELAKETKAVSVPFIRSISLWDTLIPLIGEHNKINIRAAVSVARILKISDQHIVSAIKNFKPLPHRLEYVGIYKGISFYDDAIATAPEATIAAIKSLKNIGTLFLGGYDRGYDFLELSRVIAEYKIPNIVLFPTSSTRILEAMRINNLNLPRILETKDMKEAVLFAYKHSLPGTICLLSCASPSYSIWKNFEEKGDLFKKFVREIGEYI